MFRKLLNVGKGHSNEKLQQLHQQQQQQRKDLFQLNEIRTYGFSQLCCLGYSPTLSLLAVGSKNGLLRILGRSSVEFSYQLESGAAIRQIEFIDCRQPRQQQQQQSSKNGQLQQAEATLDSDTPAKIILHTDQGELHLIELRTLKQQNFADNTTQTDVLSDCCRPQQQSQNHQQSNKQISQDVPVYSTLEHIGQLDYFKFRPDGLDNSRRLTTIEASSDGLSVFVGTESGNLYRVALKDFSNHLEELQDQQQVQNKGGNADEKEQPCKLSNNVGDEEVANKKDEADKQRPSGDERKVVDGSDSLYDEPTTPVNLSDEPQVELDDATVTTNRATLTRAKEPFEMIKFDQDVATQLGDEVKSRKQGAIESVKRHPQSAQKLLISYHRGLSVIYDTTRKQVDKYFYHNQVLESACFADQTGDLFYTSHNDGSYIRWDARKGSQARATEDFTGQVFGPYPCKPTSKIQACAGLLNDQLENLVVFSGGMPRATYDDKNPVTIVRAEPDGKDTIKTVLDFSSKVLDFAIIYRPRNQLGAGAKQGGQQSGSSTSASGGGGGGGGGGGKKKRNQQQRRAAQEQQQQGSNTPVAVALAVLAEEEFVVVDLLNSESYLEFPLPYLNCVHSSAITCNQHYSEINDHLYNLLLAYNEKQLKGKISTNEWPITGGKVIEAPEMRSHDILLTGHEDGSVNFWDVSDLTMRHLLHLSTSRFFSTSDDELAPILESDQNKQSDNALNNTSNNSNNSDAQQQDNDETDKDRAWPPLKRVGRFDPYSDDTRLALRKVSLCSQTGTLVVAGTGGQVLVFELRDESAPLEFVASEVVLVNDHRFTWKGHERLKVKTHLSSGSQQEPGYQVSSFVQLDPPAAPTALDLRADWALYALGTSYGFCLYDYANKRLVLSKCTLNPQDFAIVSGDAPGAAAMSRKKSFRKSLRESFRRLRRGRSQRAVTTGVTPASDIPKQTTTGVVQLPGHLANHGRVTTGVRSLGGVSSSLASPHTMGQEVGVSGAVQPGARTGIAFATERQVEVKVELSSIVRCLSLTAAVISNQPAPASFRPSLWVGTNSGQVLVYAITLASEQQQQQQQQHVSKPEADVSSSDDQDISITQQQQPSASAKLAKEIQLKHRAPIIAIFTSPSEAPASSDSIPPPANSIPTVVTGSAQLSPVREQLNNVSTSETESSESPVRPNSPTNNVTGQQSPNKSNAVYVQPRVLICSEEQFKVFNLPNLKPFCKFKLTAHEGLRAKKITITQFLKPANPIGSGTVKSLSSSKSMQSFAASTQTSRPSSPLSPTGAASEVGASANSQSATGAVAVGSESNNNSPSTLNNNHQMTAKFGAGKSTVNSATVDHNHDRDSIVDAKDQLKQLTLEPYLVCMSNQGDCAIYSVPDLKRQAQIQVCQREDVNGITSTMLTNYGEGFYLRSSSNFLRFSISSQRVFRVLSVV